MDSVLSIKNLSVRVKGRELMRNVSFDINPGDSLVVLGDEGQGLAIIKSEHFLNLANMIRKVSKK